MFALRVLYLFYFFFFFSSRRRHTRFDCDWSSDVCSSDLRGTPRGGRPAREGSRRPRSPGSRGHPAECRWTPPSLLGGRPRDSSTRVSGPSGFPAPWAVYVLTQTNTYAVRLGASITADRRSPELSGPCGPPHRAFEKSDSQILMKSDGIGPTRMDHQIDVLVVGAGPTGSTAAKYAALGGARGPLIAKRSQIGTPGRWGGGGAKRWLAEIGLRPNQEFICHEVDGARIIAPDGTTLVLDETRAGNESG